MGRITPTLTEYEHRHIAARPNDVEDNGTVIVNFSDGSKAVVIATDVCLGGSKNYVELYCNDANINCNLTMNDLMTTYFIDEDGLDNVYLSEMLPPKQGGINHLSLMKSFVDTQIKCRILWKQYTTIENQSQDLSWHTTLLK